MPRQTLVDAERLRSEVRQKYRAVAVEPAARYHFHTGRGLAARLGYDATIVDGLPEVAVESFAGVANALALRTPAPGERVVDVGSGAGFDSFVAAGHVGPEASFVDVVIGEPADTFRGAGGEANARSYEVFGYPFLARKPG